MKKFEEMKYRDYIWFFLFFLPNRSKTMRMTDLIQMEARYPHNVDFELKNMDTYVRCEAEGSYNSILPVISLASGRMSSPSNISSRHRSSSLSMLWIRVRIWLELS